MNDTVWQRLDAFISSIFDPEPIVFTRQNEKGVLPVRNAVLRNPPDVTVHFKKPIARNSFLLGCLDLTEHAELEHLIIGYGTKNGPGTNVRNLEYAIGDRTSVNPSAGTRSRIDAHLHEATMNEVVVFHNHPPNRINNLLDNTPVASFVDRVTLLKDKYLKPVFLFRTLSGEGSIRFYAGENGFVREYNMPNVLSLLTVLGKSDYGR